MVKRALGNWVTGDNFWDREAELDLFIEYLSAGANLLLTAPRRIGKTSLMHEAAVRMGGEFICLEVDLQKAHSPADAIVALSVQTRPHLPIWNKTKRIFGELAGGVLDHLDALQVSELTVKLRSSVPVDDWQDQGDQLLDVFAGAEKPVIIFMDEVPILVNRILQGHDFTITPEKRRSADAFMSWLRNNTLKHKGQIRFVVTGSIGFEPILRLGGLNATLNTFTPFTLGPWNSPTALGFLAEISKSYEINLNEVAAARMIENLGYCIPHYVQMYFDLIYRTCRIRGTQDATVEMVDEVYKTGMLSVQGHSEMSHLEERLRMVLGPTLFDYALELLTEVAITGRLTERQVAILAEGYDFGGRSKADVAREVLGILEHDLYIAPNANGGYSPVSKYVTDWWRARFEFGFIPADKRKVHSANAAEIQPRL
jgi:hypothetical protein